MANKTYLDKNGLTYFWSKIKTALTGKQDSLVSGTNIKTINNTSLLGSGDISISGATINNSYSTSTNKAYSCNYINSCNTYSTDEIDTGQTWIDGKKIYRKVMTDTSPNRESTTWTIPNYPSNIDTTISVLIKIIQTGDDFFDFGYSAFDIVPHKTGDYWINTLKSNYRNRPATIIIEYTKSS